MEAIPFCVISFLRYKVSVIIEIVDELNSLNRKTRMFLTIYKTTNQKIGADTPYISKKKRNGRRLIGYKNIILAKEKKSMLCKMCCRTILIKYKNVKLV